MTGHPKPWTDALSTHAVHMVAWLALRLQNPLAARRTTARIGARIRPFENLQEARSAAARLSRSGSCLSRALAIAARLPGSAVVIGVDPRWSSRLAAHAWVEFGGEPIDPTQGARRVEAIARL
jgi:hypothetical protein